MGRKKTETVLGDGFEYNPNLGRDAFLEAFFYNPESVLTMTEFMAGRLYAMENKGKEHQSIRNSWWGINTLTKSGVARYKDSEGNNLVKVFPDLGKIADKLAQYPTAPNNEGILVTKDCINSLEGFEFKRDNFNYHKKTEKQTVDGILEDPILTGICADNPPILRRYLNKLFELGGIPEERTGGILNAHLTVSCDSGVDEPIINFYGMDFTIPLFSNSKLRNKISTPDMFLSCLDNYPAVLRKF
jgi:hypothetical protein